jgi:diguanylate cyclase (GGDEF)-like protein
MRRVGPDANVNELLAYSYAAIACVGVLVWISGGNTSPYAQLFILSSIYTAAVHPPRRVAVFLAVLSVVALLPLAYDSNAPHRAQVNLVAELVMWLLGSMFAMFLMTYVRAQRLGLRREGETARRQARIDPLTGLLNRRAFDEDLTLQIARARTSGEALSVLIGDLDDFKDFNDQFGHLEGDRVLQLVGEALSASLRRPDVPYRWGGDEFAVILPQATLAGAQLAAARVEQAIASHVGPGGEPLGISTGVAELEPGAQPAQLVARADQALMSAKGTGMVDAPGARG